MSDASSRKDAKAQKAALAVARTLMLVWPGEFDDWDLGNLASYFYDDIRLVYSPPKKKQRRSKR